MTKILLTLTALIAALLIGEYSSAMTLVTDADADIAIPAAMQTGKPVIIVFSASWCEACKTYKPMLEAAEAKYKDRVVFMEVDVDKSPNVSKGITKLPSTIVIVKNQILGPLIGAAQSDSNLENFILEVLKL